MADCRQVRKLFTTVATVMMRLRAAPMMEYGTSPKGSMRTLDEALEHLKSVFIEMPGLRVTPEQARRLCGLEGTMCKTALVALVEETFLWVTADGHYMRAADGQMSRPRRAHGAPHSDHL